MLYLQPCSSFGGAERQASTNVPNLRHSGFDVLPLVGPGDTVIDWLHETGVRKLVHSPDFPGGWPRPRGLEHLRTPLRYLRCVRRVEARIEELVREHAIDLIFAAMPFSWVAATPVARRLGIPIIWRAGGTEAGRLARVILSVWATWNPPDLLVCCGEAVHRMFSPLVRAPAVVVHNGVDTERFDPDAAGGTLGGGRFRPAGARLVIGFAGRLVPQKRPEDVIRLAARVAPANPDVAFLIAGDGSRRPAYERQVRELGLEDRVRFLGYVPDMRSFYASCDVIVLPSRSEGCPNVVLESMAMRRALVVSSAAGTREVVTDESEALVFPIGDIDAFARAVTRVIDQPALRSALADRAHRRARAMFSTDASTRRLGNLLRAAMSLNQPGPSRERPARAARPPAAPSPVPPRLLDRRLAGDGGT